MHATHPFLGCWMKNFQNIERRHPSVKLCVPWKRIYEVTRHYDLSTLMLQFDDALGVSKSAAPAYYGIERIEDGIAYRLRGGKVPLKLLYPVSTTETANLFEYNIEPTIASLSALRDLLQHRTAPLGIHLWLNTGYRTLGLATKDELAIALGLIRKTNSFTCKGIGSKFPYEDGISTFSDFYKHVPTKLKATLSSASSQHMKHSLNFKNFLQGQQLPDGVLVHTATSFEVYARTIDAGTNLITVGNLFYYGFRPTTYTWPLEFQQVTTITQGHHLNNTTVATAPIRVATLISKIPTHHIVLGGNPRALGIVDEDLNYGKVVVRIPKDNTQLQFFAKRKFF